MLDEATIERRLTALEQALVDVRLGLAGPKPADNWLEIVSGSISDEPAFLEALELGRAIRQADRVEGTTDETVEGS
jgi:hypothetical protein